MALRDVTQNLVEGFAGAAGNQDVVNQIEARKQRVRDWQDLQRRTKIQDAQNAALNISQTLRSGKHPDTGEPLTPEETQKLTDASHQIATGLAQLWNPGKAIGNSSALDGLVQQYSTQPEENPYLKKFHQAKEAGFSTEEALRMVGGTGEKPPTESWKTQDITLANGQKITAQFDSKSGNWHYLDGKAIPTDLLSGAKVEGKPIQKKGLSFDKATGQVIDKDSAKRYSPGDPNNPPEVTAMFKGADDMMKKQEAFQARVAQMRGATYNLTRPLQVYDSANGNQPTYVTYGEMTKNPGRFVPTGPGGKAIAQENLFQDLEGTSKLTREAIDSLKEDFPAEMKVKIALAMRADDPHSALDQLIASGSLGSLTPDQQDFLIATRQLAENAMAMRSILGAGQGSDDVRRAIRDTLPSLMSPDRSYARRQLDAYDKTIARLRRGIPKVTLNETGGGEGGTTTTPPPGSHVIKWSDIP